MGKRALIIGVTGQDGAYMAKYLIKRGYTVYGTYRRHSTKNILWRLEHLNIKHNVRLLPLELNDPISMVRLLKWVEPDEIYYFAAQTFVEYSFKVPLSTAISTGTSIVLFLELLKEFYPEVKFFFPASSEMFGFSGWRIVRENDVECIPCNENTPFQPMSPYAAAKLYAYWIAKIYKKVYNMHITIGILFNHESILRSEDFVTKKIIRVATDIYYGEKRKLVLGTLRSKRDWGYAPEYMEAIYLMMQKSQPVEYVVATGEAHSIREFVEEVFTVMGISNWGKYIEISDKYKRPLDPQCLLGDPKKIEKEIGWKSSVKFNELVKRLVEEELKNRVK